MDGESPSLKDVQRLVERARESLDRPSIFLGFLTGVRGSLKAFNQIPFQDPIDQAGDFLSDVRDFADNQLDGDLVDREEHIPGSYLNRLRDLGCFGVKISQEYGGLGRGQSVYGEFISRLAEECSSTALTMSAHQSIGVAEPLRRFGTENQRDKWLPEIVNGALSGFALTEPTVGSDPARMETTAESTGNGYKLTGQKLWCTNGPRADLLVVLARTGPDELSAFVVPGDAGGLSVEHDCRFMGLRGISNGLLTLDDVEVPADHLVAEPGDGLRIALSLLTVGRLTMPAMCRGSGRRCLGMARSWANERVQWGKAISNHEQVSRYLVDLASDQLRLEAVSAWLASAADRTDSDLRLEASLGKYLASELLWTMADTALQVRGGRGYETADSLRERGEQPMPIERILRDARLNRIGEGTTEVLRMHVAREWLQPLVGDLIEQEVEGEGLSLRDLVGTSVSLAGKYIKTLLPDGFGRQGFLRTARGRLLRGLIHQVARHQVDLQERQEALVPFVDGAAELFSYTAVDWYAKELTSKDQNRKWGPLVDYTLSRSRRRFERLVDGQHKPVHPGEELRDRVCRGDYKDLESSLSRGSSQSGP